MRTTAALKIDRDLDNFIDTMRNASEFERMRYFKQAVRRLLAAKGYEPDLLEHKDDGWYSGCFRLGSTIQEAYQHIVEEW